MPMHDWTQVTSGTYHNFHYRWLSEIMDHLNKRLLPTGYFAMAEQRVGGPEPDIITLSTRDDDLPNAAGTALETPRTAIVERAESVHYARKANHIAIHHGLGTVVAVLELVSPGNKDTRHALRSFTRESARLVLEGIHLVVIDPFPPGRYDPEGIHPAIWTNITTTACRQPVDKPLTLVSYQAASCPTAYVEPFATGSDLPPIPLFLTEEFHLDLRLEPTYRDAWSALPAPLRQLLEPRE